MRPDYQHVDVPNEAFEPIELPSEPATLESNEQPQDSSQQAADLKTSKQEIKQENAQQTTTQAGTSYVVQVGSFSKADNVNALVANLRAAGVKAFTVPEKVVDGRLTRVVVGPDISRKSLEKQQKIIKQVAKTDGLIVRYDPLANQ
ncbi:SPOR domain-containing protein [Paraferrimonas haliotis]|uniref:SPOR domain-containing protein n=1 Tax=Paraferrimonas haliotis TaxID=2013866 RepID=UPI003D67B87F